MADHNQSPFNSETNATNWMLWRETTPEKTLSSGLLKVAEYISKDNTQDTLWQFEEIVSHQGPLDAGHKDYNGSTYNVQICWSTGDINTEP